MQQHRDLLVQIGIKLYPALLHENAGKVLEWLKRAATQISFHKSSPSWRK